ncbi:MAG: recombinase family protein [Parabacteroides sp.]|nr:recombinase family protein [Parabacteroides sp.]
MNAVLLLRCSTDSQDYDRQLKDLTQLSKDFGYTVPEYLIFGQYITGKDDVRKEDRESIRSLKAACLLGEADVIFINEVSRLSRDSITGRLWIREFNNELKVPIYFRDKGRWTIDPTTGYVDTGFEQQLGFYFDSAAEELKSMKSRFASGKRKNARRNQIFGGRPAFGYKRVGGNKADYNTLIIDEPKAAIIQDIFNRYLQEDGSLSSVLRYVKGKYDLHITTGHIRQYLTYTGYTGETTLKIADPDRPNEEPEVYVINLPQIIDKDTFNWVQKKLKENRTLIVYPKAKKYLLQKLIKCPNCGYYFSPSTKGAKGITNWRCHSKDTTLTGLYWVGFK